ncbi:MAG: hypothetical protein K6F75_12000 [Butyrivibrio sp.]|nr:hypothetical protein [Butyrivibrio sp.]
MNISISFMINMVIFVVTCFLVFQFFREDGQWNLGRARRAFRYYTTQSNVLCAISALCMSFFHDALYAPLYLYKIVYAPEKKRWEDFYGFNQKGMWRISYVLMLLGTALICVGLYFGLNLL